MRNLPGVIALMVTIGLLSIGYNKLDNQNEAGTSISSFMRVGLFMVPETTNDFQSRLIQGAREQGYTLGWKVEVLSHQKESEMGKKINILNNTMFKEASVVSLDAVELENQITKLVGMRNLKPVFVHNNSSTITLKSINQYIGCSERTAGYKCGEYAVKLLNGVGKIFIIDGSLGIIQTQRTGGFIDAIKEYPDIKIVGEKSSDWNMDKAENSALNAFEINPDINLFFCNNGEMAVGASIAAKKLGKNVFTIGFGESIQTLDKIINGDITATCGTYPDKMGSLVIRQMDDIINGNNISGYMKICSVIIDKSNLQQYTEGKLWVEPVKCRAEEISR